MSNTRLYDEDNYVGSQAVHRADERRYLGAFVHKRIME